MAQYRMDARRVYVRGFRRWGDGAVMVPDVSRPCSRRLGLHSGLGLRAHRSAVSAGGDGR